MSISNLTLNHFGHYIYAIKEIRTGLKSDHNILVNGHSGCGKSTIVNMLLEEQNFEVLKIDPSSYENIGNIKNRLTCFSKTNTIASYIRRQPKIIFIDDLDVIVNIDRNFYSFIIDFIRSSQCKILCVNNTLMNKKALDTKGCFDTIVNLKRLTYKQCFQIVITNIEDDDIDYDQLSAFIKSNNNDLRTIMNNIDDVKIGKNNIDLKKRPKYLEMNTNEIIEELCSHMLSETELNEVITHDINHIIAALHENIQQWFSGKVLDVNEINFMSDFNNIVINSEFVGKYIFDKYDFSTWDHYTYDKMKSINYILYNQFHKSTKLEIAHSQLINKQSLALNFNKKLVKMEKEHGINRMDCSSILFYLHSMIHSSFSKDEIMKVVTKNDFEIITRFLSDYFPKSKQQLLKLKNSMLK